MEGACRGVRIIARERDSGHKDTKTHKQWRALFDARHAGDKLTVVDKFPYGK